MPRKPRLIDLFGTPGHGVRAYDEATFNRIVCDRSLAFDLSRARTYDRDGRLRVEATNISKANVCEYGGWEIPGADELGLDPSRTYRLWRHPDELAKAAKTFNNVPLLIRHVAAHADDHKPMDVCGATGSDAEFVAPFLRNSIVIWARQAIDGVEDRSRRELSCGYFYKPEMRAGRTPQGEAYDGIMRQIHGSHLALVERGRAGSDVLVADAALRSFSKEQSMRKYPMALDAAPQDGRWLDDPDAVKTVLQFLLSKLPPDQLAELDEHLTKGTTPQAMDYRMPESKLKAEFLNYTPKNRAAIRQSMDDVRNKAMGLDEGQRKSFEEMFPNAGRLK